MMSLCACRAAQHAQNASSVLQEGHWIGGSITTQQKAIRMGLGQLGSSSRAPKPRRRSNADAKPGNAAGLEPALKLSITCAWARGSSMRISV